MLRSNAIEEATDLDHLTTGVEASFSQAGEQFDPDFELIKRFSIGLFEGADLEVDEDLLNCCLQAASDSRSEPCYSQFTIREQYDWLYRNVTSEFVKWRRLRFFRTGGPAEQLAARISERMGIPSWVRDDAYQSVALRFMIHPEYALKPDEELRALFSKSLLHAAIDELFRLKGKPRPKLKPRNEFAAELDVAQQGAASATTGIWTQPPAHPPRWDELPDAFATDPVASAQDHELVCMVLVTARKMPARWRGVFADYCRNSDDGWTQIAERLGISPRAAEYRWNKAFVFLKKRIQHLLD